MLKYIGKYKIFAILAPLAVMGEVFLEIQLPMIMADIVDVGITSGDISYVIKRGVQMAIYSVISLILGALAARFSALAAMGMGSNLRDGMFRQIQDFSFKNIDKFSTASLVTRLTTDVTSVQNAFMMLTRGSFRAPVMMLSAMFMAFRINRKLSVVFMIAVPLLAISLGFIASAVFPRFKKMLEKYDKLNASVQENLIAIRVVKAYVRSKHEKEKFRASNDELKAAAIAAEKVLVINGPLMQLAVYSCIVAIMWFGGKMVTVGELGTGELIGFLAYVNQILMSLMMLTMIFVMIVISRNSATRIAEVLDEKTDITDENSDDSLRVADGSIEFKNVSFKYSEKGEKNVLENINIKINSGETIGIIGATGSAKTTLVQLIARLYDVSAGEVLVGGHNVRNYKIENLRKEIGFVIQKNLLFSGTIKENIKWGNPQADEGQIENACRAAQAHDFIMSFPNGYNTDLGQGGVNVSGGQKQRLCIARALLKNPKILILDDSTSAVDTATDAKIRESLRNISPDTTTIIIAQRIASVSDADRIIILDDGKIDAVGTHDNLLVSNKIYGEIYKSQKEGNMT